ncbi:MAG TPA: SRPBCC domain-containing protein [Candidatus Limnocylindria bacterium]|nr:SRPBCC domain-containing protein [Candidatus Limnocylindria bacterium]
MATRFTASDAPESTDLVIRKTVTVPLSQKAAFKLFTEGMGTWWPALTHSVAASTAAVAAMGDRVGGEIYEQTDGGKVTWGTITAWDDPEGFSSTWHPGYGPELATQLTVRFIAEGPSTTRVELEHRGWEVHGESAEGAFRGYTVGWDPVLSKYVERAGG